MKKRGSKIGYSDESKADKRLFPKPRKHARLWQLYLMWNELSELRKRHNLRIDSARKGRSNMDPELEQLFIATLGLDAQVDPQNKAEREKSVETLLIKEAEACGDIYTWLTGIKGMGAGGMASQLIAMIDDPSNFATISKLWRFAVGSVVDGKAERNHKGEISHFSRKFKSLVYLIVDQFIKQRTPVYSDMYYAEKERQRGLHPDALCEECGIQCEKSTRKNGDGEFDVWRCPNDAKHHTLYSDLHIHRMAMRKVGKIFLSHVWVKWREFEGLPVSEPYVQAVLGHQHIVKPADQ